MRRSVVVAMAVVLVAVIAVTGYLAYLVFANRWDDDAVVAYVGDVAITEVQVDAVVDDLREARQADAEEFVDRLSGDVGPAERTQIIAQQLRGLDDRLALDRDRVMEMRIITEAGQRYAERAGLEVPEPAFDVVAADLGLDPDHAYIRVFGEFAAVMNVLYGRAQPAEPSADDQREVYDNLVADELTTAPFEEWQELLTMEVIGEPVGVRDLLTEVVAAADVRVKPGYELVYQVPVPIADESSWLGVRLSD